MQTLGVTYQDVKVGDKVMPPPRELSLWMRKDVQQKGLNEDALLLTVTEIIPGAKFDKGGEWVEVKANYSMEFAEGRPFGYGFYVRPHTIIKKWVA